MFNIETGEFERIKKSTVAGSGNNILDKITASGHSAKEVLDLMEIMGRDGRAITITFDDYTLMKYTEKYLMVDIENIMKKTRCVLKYTLVADWSKVGRFHLHGVIIFTDITKIQGLRRKLAKHGRTKVVVITDSVGWSEYCMKQYSDEGKKGVIIPEEKLKYIIKH